MDYEFRTLCAKDIFPMCKIISAIGFKEFRACFENDELKRIAAGGEKPDYSAIGVGIFFDVANVIITNLPKCEHEIYTFLASISNLSVKNIEQMDISSFVQMIVGVIRKPEFKDFFKVVSKFIK